MANYIDLYNNIINNNIFVTPYIFGLIRQKFRNNRPTLECVYNFIKSILVNDIYNNNKYSISQTLIMTDVITLLDYIWRPNRFKLGHKGGILKIITILCSNINSKHSLPLMVYFRDYDYLTTRILKIGISVDNLFVIKYVIDNISNLNNKLALFKSILKKNNKLLLEKFTEQKIINSLVYEIRRYKKGKKLFSIMKLKQEISKIGCDKLLHKIIKKLNIMLRQELKPLIISKKNIQGNKLRNLKRSNQNIII